MSLTDSLSNMKRAAHIQEELDGLGADMLGKASSVMPYSLPVSYFSELESGIKDFITINQIEHVQPEWGHEMPFSVPDASYFEGLSARIMAKVQEEEPSWGKTNPYTVPQGYFDALPAIVVVKVKPEAAPQVVKKTIPLFRTVQLAASMALIFFAGFAVMKMGNTRKASNTTVSATVSKVDIKNYVEANIDDFDTDLILNSLAQSNTKQDKKVTISDAEIRAYLDETGWN